VPRLLRTCRRRYFAWLPHPYGGADLPSAVCPGDAAGPACPALAPTTGLY